MMVDNHESPMPQKTTQEMVRGWFGVCVPKTWVEWGVIVAVMLVLIAIQMPAVQHGHPDRAIRSKLRGMNVAMEAYQLEHAEFSRDVTIDGVVVHGWQTLLLPQLGYGELFERIELKKPWDDGVNRAAFQERIREFELPSINDKRHPGVTSALPVIQSAGNSQVMNQPEIHSANDITDGTSQTLFLGEIDSQLTSWGQPGNVRDPAIGLNQPAGFGGCFDQRVFFLLADGSVQGIRVGVDAEVLRALASPKG